MSIRVIIADDHKIMRDGLRALLEMESDIKIVGEAADGQTVLRLARQTRPEVAVMDIAMPGLNGLEATRKITAEVPGIKVIALSMYSDKKFVYRMFKAGASGYLLKDSAFEELVRAIRMVINEKVYVGPGIAGTVVKGYIQKALKTDSSVFSVLSDRQREVLQLLSEGQSAKEIAYQLDVSVKTIETHRNAVMKKLDIHSIAELTKYAIREGLTSL